MSAMPGESYRGPLPLLTGDQRQMAANLRQTVDHLATGIGARHVYAIDRLNAAADFIEDDLARLGYRVERQYYQVEGVQTANLIAEIKGSSRAAEIVVVGAHYDTIPGTPGANDNGSGVAALLELARLFAGRKPARTLRFVAFTNEEPPFFHTELMGSMVYARACRSKDENIVAMLSLETIGYYSDEAESQHYPFPFSIIYPDTGDFIAFVGDRNSSELVQKCVGTFRSSSSFPSEGAAVSSTIPGIGWSDQWSFWQVGYQALMVTDTAPFRYPHYHTGLDTADRLDYGRMARITEGLEKVLQQLVSF